MSAAPYLDTSALAKWYLNEPRSEDFEAYITRQPSAAISRLTVVELRCLLARRRRSGDIGRAHEARVVHAFEADVRRGALHVHPVEDQHLLGALDLLGRLQKHPLRTLDAIHLAIVLNLGIRDLDTADRVMADAAKTLGLAVIRFY